jgi:uncharacterized protein YjdB
VVASVAITWESSNPQVATVGRTDGRVLAVSAGETVLSATAGGKRAEKPLTVSPRQADLAITPTQPSIVSGQAIQLIASNATTTVSWSSSDSLIAKVNGTTGVVTGRIPGTATITAVTGVKTATASVTVKDPTANSVVVNILALTLPQGASAQLAVVVRDAGGKIVASPAATWATNNAAVATITNAGLVTAIATGTATITAISDGRSATTTITVIRTPVASVELTPSPVQVDSAQVKQLTAILKDGSGAILTGRQVTWTSANPSIATVSSAGLVTGVSTGNTTVSAASEGKVATVTVSVNRTQLLPTVITKVSGDNTACTLGTFECRFEAKVTDSQGTPVPGAEVRWSIPACKDQSGNQFVFQAFTDATGISRVTNVCTYGVGAAEVTTTQTATLAATGANVTFTFKLTPPAPSSTPSGIEKVSGDNSTCAVSTFDCRFTVKVTNAEGAPVKYAQVQWSVPGCADQSGNLFVYTTFTSAEGLTTISNVCTYNSAVTAKQTAKLANNGATVTFTFMQQ